MIVDVLAKSLMISAFVFVMMLAIEYVNTCTQGAAQRAVCGGRWRQYLLAAGLGATPGCLGAFVSVSLYVHGLLSLGALVGCMIATCGDEAFVLLAMSPRLGLLLMAILFVVGVAAGWLTDVLTPGSRDQSRQICQDLVVHQEAACGRSSWREIVGFWRSCSAARGILATSLLLFLVAVALGELGPAQWNWIRVTLLLVTLFALFVVSTSPDHFLEEHLWNHVAKEHVPRIFIWTFAALLLTHFAMGHVTLASWIQEHPLVLLVVACVLGIIPESGPHLLFVTLYVEGNIPFSVLLASSIVQDGHGMLPLLGDSFSAFLKVKAINVGVGLVIGLIMLTFGW